MLARDNVRLVGSEYGDSPTGRETGVDHIARPAWTPPGSCAAAFNHCVDSHEASQSVLPSLQPLPPCVQPLPPMQPPSVGAIAPSNLESSVEGIRCRTAQAVRASRSLASRSSSPLCLQGLPPT